MAKEYSVVNWLPHISVDCVIFGFEENKLKVLVIKSDLEYYKNHYSLLGDIVKDNEELDEAAYRILKERYRREKTETK